MAVTAKGRIYQLTAAADTLAGKVRVNAIDIITSATGTTTVTTLTVGAASAITIYTVPAATLAGANRYPVMSFTEPQEMDDLTVSALSTNAFVIVYTC